MGIFIGILILSLMMLVHELGHYITGRLLGFKIIEFSIFMGPVITSWTSKKTGIKYSLKLLPIGASVRFVGEEGMGEDASEDPESFNLKPAWKRAIVLSTGAGINILSGIIALSILFSTTGFVTTEISQIQTDSQAATVSLDPGVKVISVNGARIITSIDYAMEMSFIPPDNNVDLIVKDPETGEVNDFDGTQFI
ncbi:RIP metalloprotease, partial [Candidatus Nomurabacteria bacterium]|nr:RIP metalloprotease [Candidatus Nomurabacteria bacterium]